MVYLCFTFYLLCIEMSAIDINEFFSFCSHFNRISNKILASFVVVLSVTRKTCFVSTWISFYRVSFFGPFYLQFICIQFKEFNRVLWLEKIIFVSKMKFNIMANSIQSWWIQSKIQWYIKWESGLSIIGR